MLSESGAANAELSGRLRLYTTQTTLIFNLNLDLRLLDKAFSKGPSSDSRRCASRRGYFLPGLKHQQKNLNIGLFLRVSSADSDLSHLNTFKVTH